MKYKLGDDVLFHIVQLMQLGMITQTDVADHFRRIEMNLSSDGLHLNLTPEYREMIEKNYEQMVEEAKGLGAEQVAKSNGDLKS